MLRSVVVALALVVAGSAIAADTSSGSGLPRTKSPAGVELYFISPLANSTQSSPVTVRFGLKGMGVAPAGTIKDGTGHHHLLVDVEDLPAMDMPIPNDARHLHFGAGQTETVLTLAPGDHSLQLLLGDAAHIPFDPPILSPKITVHVK